MTGTGFPSPQVQYLASAGGRLTYREFGEGAPAVMVHGLGGMATSWTGLVHALPLHSVAVDLPGFGASSNEGAAVE